MRIRDTILGMAVVLTAGTMARAQSAEAPATSPSVVPTTRESTPATSPSAGPLSSQPIVLVRGFRFVGNTRLTDEQLQKIVARYVGQAVSSEQLDQARQALTQAYVDAGYMNSGAVLPDQTVAGGIITFKIIEGKLGDVAVTFKDANGKPTNRHWLRTEYVAQRLFYATAPPPLNLLKLKDELELLRQDRNIAQINAELKPGTEPGDSRLDVQVRESNPWFVLLQWSNRRNPTVGSTAYDLIASNSDVTGRGDNLRVQYDIAAGSIGDPRLQGADDFSVGYSIPISPADTTISIDFTRTNSLVTQLPFTPLDITSHTDSTALTLRQPIYRRPVAEPATSDHGERPSMEVDLFGGLALHDNTTALLGRSFSFAPGQENGSGRATVIRFGQELTMRGQADALSARSTFSLGVPWFGSTPSTVSGEASGKYFAWVGQVQYVRAMEIKRFDFQIALRAAAQFSDRPLLPVEQFSLGGIDSVRGYPENDLVRDDGIVGSAELHIPIIHGVQGNQDVLTLVPFVDGGYGWNRSHGSASSEALESVGLGVVCAPNRQFNAQVFYGLPLKNHANSSHDPEDLGLHFIVSYVPF